MGPGQSQGKPLRAVHLPRSHNRKQIQAVRQVDGGNPGRRIMMVVIGVADGQTNKLSGQAAWASLLARKAALPSQ